MVTDDFQASVGLSRKWDAREAGREVASNALESLNDKKPNFILLFSTIHYKKNGGFKELLKGVWEVLPKGTPLVGGTIPGFMIPQGCFTRGVTALAVNYPNMDIAIGIGNNSKRNPIQASRDCANMLKKKLEHSTYPTSFVFEVLSGAKAPKIPKVGMRKVIKLNLLGKAMLSGFTYSTQMLQMGLGREAESFDELVEQLSEYTLIGVTCIDDNNLFYNSQFIGESVTTNAVICLGIKTDLNTHVNTTFGLKKTDISFEVNSTSLFGCSLRKLDSQPATKRFLEKMGWPDEFLNELIDRKTAYTPIGFENDGVLITTIPVFFYGDEILCTRSIEEGIIHVYSISGRSLLETVDENLKEFANKDNKIAFVVPCTVRMETLGSNIYSVWKKLKFFFKDTPFLLVYGGGEEAYSPEKKGGHYSMSFNVATLYSNKN